MSNTSASVFVSNGAVAMSILGLLAIFLIFWGVWLFLGSKQTAAQRERQRRVTVSRTGRMGDATIIDVRDCVLYYSYELGGVSYTAAQDASEFRDMLPSSTSVLIGPVGIKYSPGNPANSIVICEEWSGLRPVTLQLDLSQIKENSG